MKKRYIVANWKANTPVQDAHSWLEQVAKSEGSRADQEVIVCPSFTQLPQMHWYINQHKLSIALGAQDVSQFGLGAYTGAIAAEQLKELVSYVIVGHSERRSHFGETDAVVSEKAKRAEASGITPIVCVQGIETPVPEGVTIVAYEPVFAIGSGTPDTPDNAAITAKTIKERYGVSAVLYGGSVTPENAKSFFEKDEIDGVLVGGASLDALEFERIITAA